VTTAPCPAVRPSSVLESNTRTAGPAREEAGHAAGPGHR
jgi:hypothetical protein